VLPFQSETFCPLTESPKVQLSAILKKKLETEVPTEELQDVIPQSSDNMKTEEPELDYHQEPEKPYPVIAEPPSELSLEEEELTSPSLRQETNSTNIKERERSGRRLEVLL